MKKVLSILLAVVMAVGLAACAGGGNDGSIGGEGTKLATPQDLNLSADGLISWSYVEHASSYTLTVDGDAHDLTATQYQLDSLPTHDFTYSVVAKAAGYEDSDAATMTYTAPAAVVSIQGDSSILEGTTKTYTATVTGATPATVTWSIVSGGDAASISQDGVLTAKDVDGDTPVMIRATSVANTGKYAEKRVTVRVKADLTQAMLDEVSVSDTVEFMSSIDIEMYTIGSRPQYAGSTHLDTTTAMDGTNWYAQYETGDGLSREIYYTKHNGKPSMVSVTLMNEEEYYPMIDEDGSEIDWYNSGLYNCFKGTTDHPQNLKVSDFEYDDDNYGWKYVGADKTFMERMVASSNPYDFKPIALWLLIDEGAVVGFISQSDVDKQVSSGHDSYMTLTSTFNFTDVEVHTISKFTYDEEIHKPLKDALDKMHALKSYTMIFRKLEQGLLTGNSIALEGYKETVTEDVILYEDFDWDYDLETEGYPPVYHFNGIQYGYKQVRKPNDAGEKGLYDQFVLENPVDPDETEETSSDTPPVYSAVRAFEGDMKEGCMGLNFAAEIFTNYAKPQAGDDFDMYYEVADGMFMVATEFYHYVDILDQLYGMYATLGSTGTRYIRPSITVKDGYITEMMFYYNMGYLSGVIEIEFSDFNTATIDKDISFTEREVPTDWSGTFFNPQDKELATEPFEKHAKEYLKTEEGIPFFGDALGDCFAFAMEYFYRDSKGKTHTAVSLWYDIPADLDYTIDSSINKVKAFLEANDYTASGVKEGENGTSYEYEGKKLSVAISDEQAQLFIYVWVNSAETPEITD